jgi:hypothetical protein
MEAVISGQSAPYHRFKAERSNVITRKKIARHLGRSEDAGLSEMVSSWLDERFPSRSHLSVEGPIWVDYLGYWLVSPATASSPEPALKLRPDQIATLSALVPDIFHGAPEIVELAKARRAQDPRLLEAWHQMASIEELRQRAWGRCQFELPRDYETWVATLEGWRNSVT